MANVKEGEYTMTIYNLVSYIIYLSVYVLLFYYIPKSNENRYFWQVLNQTLFTVPQTNHFVCFL